LASLARQLSLGVFGVHTVFIDDKVDEAGPVFSSGAGAAGLASDTISKDLAADMNAAAVEVDMPAEVAVDEEMPAPAASEPEIMSLKVGNFIGRAHPTSGVAEVLNDGSKQRFLRLEDFESDNGPDLYDTVVIWCVRFGVAFGAADLA
jgi:hypothetical protein